MSFLPKVRSGVRKKAWSEDEKRPIVEQWLTLRQSIGSAAAARMLGVIDSQISYWARTMGYKIPKAKGGNFQKWKQGGPGTNKGEKA